MGKCFLGLEFGALTALAYFVSNFMKYGEHWDNCLSNSLEWLFVGLLLSVCAITGYTLYRTCLWLRERRR